MLLQMRQPMLVEMIQGLQEGLLLAAGAQLLRQNQALLVLQGQSPTQLY